MCCGPCLQEPFGLTLIEAAAHGVPIVATTNGGPVDIIHTLKNGELVDPTNEQAVANALLKLLTSNATWDEYSTNGVTNINAYSWSSHCMKCLDAVEAGKVRRRLSLTADAVGVLPNPCNHMSLNHRGFVPAGRKAHRG